MNYKFISQLKAQKDGVEEKGTEQFVLKIVMNY